MTKLFLRLCVPLIAMAGVACQNASAPAPSQDSTVPAQTGANQTASIALPLAATGALVQAAGLELHLPEGWVQEAPENNMRAAQATIPGDAGPGQLTVFFFGPGGGGGVEANIQRWIGQMELDPGATPSRNSFNVGDLHVTLVEATGLLKASTIGSFPSTDQPGYTLFGAVVEGTGGPWFFRAVGPQDTMIAQRQGFLAMLQSANTQA